jgi:hypothetical protein
MDGYWITMQNRVSEKGTIPEDITSRGWDSQTFLGAVLTSSYNFRNYIYIQPI